MYLTEAIQEINGTISPIVGLLPGISIMTKKLTIGYRLAESAHDGPLLCSGEMCVVTSFIIQYGRIAELIFNQHSSFTIQMEVTSPHNWMDLVLEIYGQHMFTHIS